MSSMPEQLMHMQQIDQELQVLAAYPRGVLGGRNHEPYASNPTFLISRVQMPRLPRSHLVQNRLPLRNNSLQKNDRIHPKHLSVLHRHLRFYSPYSHRLYLLRYFPQPFKFHLCWFHILDNNHNDFSDPQNSNSHILHSNKARTTVH